MSAERWYITKPCNEATLVWCGGHEWIWEDEALKNGRGKLKARFFATEAEALEACGELVRSSN